jgi:hypothetical protein
VSIKYIRSWPGGLDAFEIGIGANIRHGGENFCETAPGWARQGGGEDFPMLGLRAAPVGAGTLFQRANQDFIDVTDKKVSHIDLLDLISLLSD